MKERYKRLSSEERRTLINKVVRDCEKLANEYIRNWKPIDPTLKTIDGCAYIRLSTDQQGAVEDGSLIQQVHICVAEVISRSRQDRVNYRIVRFFIEPGYTGRNDRRPKFQALCGDIKRSVFRFVVIKEIARIARETKTWKVFFQICHSVGCRIIIRGFPFDPNSPEQIMQLDILAVFAEYESNLIGKRTRESAFSAMITSGKFNSTHLVLGLDPLVVNGQPKPGYYSANHDELKTVEWIMRTFVKYASYQKVLEECQRKGIVNKNDKPFSANSLRHLLTNMKLIGKWEVNSENKDKDPMEHNLMPTDHYRLVDLPHGAVVDLQLWKEVQRTVSQISNIKTKNRGIKKDYVLSGGVLRYKDGSKFHGTGAWGKTGKVVYYYNEKNKIRLPAEVLENEARKILSKVIQDSPQLREAIRRRGTEKESGLSLLKDEIYKKQLLLQDLERERQVSQRRLDFLLAASDATGAEQFKVDYGRTLERIAAQERTLQEQLAHLSVQERELTEDSFDWKDIGKRSAQILDMIADNDPVALKNAYRQIFERITVCDLDQYGVRTLQFEFKNEKSPESFVTAEDVSSVDLKMG